MNCKKSMEAATYGRLPVNVAAYLMDWLPRKDAGMDAICMRSRLRYLAIG